MHRTCGRVKCVTAEAWAAFDRARPWECDHRGEHVIQVPLVILLPPGVRGILHKEGAKDVVNVLVPLMAGRDCFLLGILEGGEWSGCCYLSGSMRRLLLQQPP